METWKGPRGLAGFAEEAGRGSSLVQASLCSLVERERHGKEKERKEWGNLRYLLAVCLVFSSEKWESWKMSLEVIINHDGLLSAFKKRWTGGAGELMQDILEAKLQGGVKEL